MSGSVVRSLPHSYVKLNVTCALRPASMQGYTDQQQAKPNEVWKRKHLRALSWAVGMAMTREEVLYCSRRVALAVLSSIRMWPFRGSGNPKPGKSSSSNSTAVRSDCASASSGLLQDDIIWRIRQAQLWSRNLQPMLLELHEKSLY